MKKLIRLIILLGFSGLLWATPVQAVSLSFSPSILNITKNTNFVVDILVSGLGDGVAPSVGAFDLDVGIFNPNLVTPLGVGFFPFLGDPDPAAFETLTDFVLLPGLVDIVEVSLLFDFELDALQPADFPLARLAFLSGDTHGTILLDLPQAILSDAFGDEIAITSTGTAVVAIPLPNTLFLLGIGLAGLIWVKRKVSSRVLT